MAISVISTPFLTDGSDESGLSAVNSQAPFEFQRADFSNVKLGDNSGDVEFELDTDDGNVTSQFTDGDEIVLTGFADSTKDGTYIVKSATYAAPVLFFHTFVRCYEAYTASTTGGVMTLDRVDYHVLIEIMLPDNSARLVDQLFVYVPRQDGYLFFDLGPIMAGIMESFELKYLAYSIQYSEYFDNTQGATDTIDEPVDAVLARRQIGKLKGTNLWDWVLKGVANDYGKLFTDFHEPKVWRSHIRTIDVVFDVHMGSRINPLNTITIRYLGLDINKVVDGASHDESILPSVWFDNPQMHSMDLKTVIELPAFANSEYVQINILDGATPLLDPLACLITDPCTVQSIMLEWLNDVGGSEQWVFGYNQQVIEDVNVGEVIEFPIVEDYSNVRKTKGRDIQDEIQRITLTAENLQENEIRALKYIKSSPRLRIELDGNFYHVVVVGTFTTPWETAHSMHSFSVTIELPEEFDYFERVPL